jgi:D-3-phosphoglycerate dehydrogenase
VKILFVDSAHPLLADGLRADGHQITEDYKSDWQAIDWPAFDGLVIRSRFPITEEIMARASQLRFIARVGAGLENIDLEAANKANITVIKAPEGNQNAVAEHAIGMLLMLFNRLKQADAEVRKGLWQREANRGLELAGKTVGVIGFGYMGTAFAKKALAMGCRVLSYDRYKQNYTPEGIEEVGLKQLQAEAEIVSLHVDQRPETVGLIDTKYLAGFRQPIYFVNTARGKSVVTEALVEALKTGKVLGACLDVLEYEKSSFESLFTSDLPVPFQYLTQSEKVILSPHIAGWTQESLERLAQTILEKIRNL